MERASHRRVDASSVATAVSLVCLVMCACRASLPQPASAPQPDNAFVEVPYPPPAAHVERLPARPSSEALWVDGQWSWAGGEWAWVPGAWVAPSPGSRFARWQLRLEADGQLKFAGSSWRDASGHETAPPRVLATALGEESGEPLPMQCR
jgi:hypothetical protein